MSPGKGGRNLSEGRVDCHAPALLAMTIICYAVSNDDKYFSARNIMGNCPSFTARAGQKCLFSGK